MEELRSAVNDHVDLVSNLIEMVSADLRDDLHPIVDNLVGFFHTIDWKEPWMICLISFHTIFSLIAVLTRKNTNFQLCLSAIAFSSIYFAERINSFLAENWKSFATQNYFDESGIFMAALWSGPLLLISMIIVASGSIIKTL